MPTLNLQAALSLGAFFGADHDLLDQLLALDDAGLWVRLGAVAPEQESRLREHLARQARPTGDAVASIPEVGPAEYTSPTGEQVLGEGGLGRVLAMDSALLKRGEALKVCRTTDFTAEQLLITEAQRMARLQHPNIPPVFRLARREGKLFYSTQNLEGDNLQTQIDQRPTLAERLELVPSIADAGRALASAHQKQTAHRDVKPANIIRAKSGATHLIDWSFAAPLRSGQPSIPPGPQFVGTPGYMSPEQVKGEPIDARSDLFSLGATLWTVVCGQLPASGAATPTDLDLPGWKQLRAQGPKVKRKDRQRARELLTIARKAMSPDPKDRYATAEELVASLEAWLVARAVPSHRYSAGESLTRFGRDHAAQLTVGTGALAALLITFVGLSAWATVQKGVEQTLRDEARGQRDKLQTQNEALEQQTQRAEAAKAEAQRQAALAQAERDDKQQVLDRVRGVLYHQVVKLQGAGEALRTIQDTTADPGQASVELASAPPAVLRNVAEWTDNEGFADYQVGENAQALAQYQRCAAALELLDGRVTFTPDQVKSRGRCLMGVGDALDSLGRFDEAAQAMAQADALDARELSARPNDALAVSDSLILSRLGAIQREIGHLDDAERSFLASRARVEPLQQSRDGWTRDSALHRVSVCDLYLGYLDLARGRWAPARERFGAGLAIDEARMSRDTAEARVHSDVVEDLVGLALVDLAEGHPETARPRLARAAELMAVLTRADPNRVEWKLYVIKVEDAAGLAAAPGSPEAAEHFGKVLEQAQSVLARDPADAHGRRALALAYLRLDRVDDRAHALEALVKASPDDLVSAAERFQWQVATGQAPAKLDLAADALLGRMRPSPDLRESVLVSWALARRLAGDEAGARALSARAVPGEGAVDLQPLLWLSRTRAPVRQALGGLTGGPTGSVHFEDVAKWLSGRP